MRDLRARIATNLKRYQSGTFAELADEAGAGDVYFELENSEVNSTLLATLDGPDGADLKEAKNSAIVDRALKVTSYQARDERLWVYLCHTSALEYIRKRYPKIL